MKTVQRPLGQGFPGGRFFLCLWLKLWSAQKRKGEDFVKSRKKLEKTTLFSRKEWFSWWTIQDLNL